MGGVDASGSATSDLLNAPSNAPSNTPSNAVDRRAKSDVDGALLRSSLEKLKRRELRERAQRAGAGQDEIDEADEGAKGVLVDLVLRLELAASSAPAGMDGSPGEAARIVSSDGINAAAIGSDERRLGGPQRVECFSGSGAYTRLIGHNYTGHNYMDRWQVQCAGTIPLGDGLGVYDVPTSSEPSGPGRRSEAVVVRARAGLVC